jgi:hypothetical protein
VGGPPGFGLLCNARFPLGPLVCAYAHGHLVFPLTSGPSLRGLRRRERFS